MKEIWAAEPTAVKNYLEKVENLKLDENFEKYQVLIESDNNHQKASDLYEVKGNEAVIKIVGILTKTGPNWITRFFGIAVTGYNQIITAVSEIAANEDITMVRIQIDSPGGEAFGVDEVHEAIKNLGERKKVIAECHGMVASGAYWIACAAEKIVSFSPLNMIGSIGVVVSGWDDKEYYEKMGIKRVKLLSKSAPDKQADIGEKKGQAILQDRIDTIERLFLLRISEGRGKSVEEIKEKFGQGNILMSRDLSRQVVDALAVGMIDEVKGDEININNNDSNKTKTNVKEDDMEPKTLAEFLTANPSAKFEVEALEKKAFDRGVKETKEVVQARIDKAIPILKSAEYPESIKVLAAKVITGEEEASALTAVVTMHDADVEKEKSEAAADKSGKLPDSPPEPNLQSGKEGEIKTAEELDKVITETREYQGLGGK